jgi:ubiquinone biosynthesis protein
MKKQGFAEKLKRYRQIGNIVTKYGFGIILEKTHLLKFLKISFRGEKQRDAFTAPVRTRKMLEELGPTFIKMGQILSTRPDLIPISFIKELEKLQDKTKVLPYEEIKVFFQKETGKNIEDTFEYFEKEPLASASISQVYKAGINGHDVAVKIRKPGVEKQIYVDIQILYDLAELIEKFIKESRLYQPVKIVEEFERTIKKELDFSLEARNIKRFRKNFRSSEEIYVPAVYENLTGKKILVLEFISGVKVNNLHEIEKWGLDKKHIADIGVNSFLKQIFTDGFFHGDPHPGNIFILKNGKLCFLDFGIVGRLNEEQKLHLVYFLNGLLKANPDKIIKALKFMGNLNEKTDIKSFKLEITDTLDKYRDLPLKDIKLTEVMEESFHIMRKFNITIPSSLSILAKAILSLEGVGSTLSPDFNLTENLKPYITEIIEKKLRITNMWKDLIDNTQNLYYLFREFPATIESLFTNIKKGYLNIAFEHKGLHDLTSTINKSSNRISFSLIIAALLISSSLIMDSGKGPLIMNLPVFGIAGFIISAVLGIWLLIGIIKGGEM